MSLLLHLRALILSLNSLFATHLGAANLPLVYVDNLNVLQFFDLVRRRDECRLDLLLLNEPDALALEALVVTGWWGKHSIIRLGRASVFERRELAPVWLYSNYIVLLCLTCLYLVD